MTRTPFGIHWILALLVLLSASMAHAQLTIEIIGGGATTIPIAIVPFASEADLPARHHRRRRRTIWRGAACSSWSTPAAWFLGPSRPKDVRYGDWTARGADAVVVGSMTPLPDGRVEVRFSLLDVVKQSLLAGFTYLGHAGAASRHRARDRRRHLRKADRRRRRVQHAHRLHRQAGRDATSCWSPRPTASIRSRSSAPTSRCSRRCGRPTARASPTCRWRTRSRWSTCSRWRPVAVRSSPTFRGSNSAPAWSPDSSTLAVTLSKDGGSQLYLINADGSGVQRLMNSGGHRHRSELCARRTVDPVHLRPRRQPADLPADARRRRGRAHDLRRQLQRFAAQSSRRQGLRVRASRRQPLQHRDAGFRDAAGAGAHARRARRIAERRAERQADHLRIGDGGPWYIGRRLQRRSCQAAI